MECHICTGQPLNYHRCEKHKKCDTCNDKKGQLGWFGEGMECFHCYYKRVRKAIESFSGDTRYTHEITCPWCGYEQSDSWEWGEGKNNCNECGNEFEMERDLEVTYCTIKTGSDTHLTEAKPTAIS